MCITYARKISVPRSQFVAPSELRDDQGSALTRLDGVASDALIGLKGAGSVSDVAFAADSHDVAPQDHRNGPKDPHSHMDFGQVAVLGKTFFKAYKTNAHSTFPWRSIVR